MKIIQEVKTEPRQTVPQMIQMLGISRSQYYKDKDILKNMGFDFTYSRSEKRFILIRDYYPPIEGLSLSERLSLIMAFRQLSATGEYLLTFDGLNAAKKLAAELPEPLRDSLFDDIVLKEGFGCNQEIMERLQHAVTNRQRVILTYQRPGHDEPELHELEPYHIFFRRRALYAEGYSWTEKMICMYRLNRITKVEYTPYGFKEIRDNYNFGTRHRNAFSAFPGDTTEHVKIRFNRRIGEYIRETLWHHSQKITPAGDGGILFEVDVAYPREVMWWAFQWGAGAEVLEPLWLREEAKETIRKMSGNYLE